MPEFLTSLTIALLAVGATALPTWQSWPSRYPPAQHSIPLYSSSIAIDGDIVGDITVGLQTVRAVMDTGSSNTFFLDPDTQCLNSTTFKPVPARFCGFNSPRLEPSPSFQPIPNEHFNLSFGNGVLAIASPGYQSISFGGVEVPKQEIGLATTITWDYLGNATGLVGLAFPALTDSYPGNDPSKDVSCGVATTTKKPGCNEQNYSPLLSTMFTEGLAPPVFALAISRSAPKGGVMTIGGLPDVHDPHVNVTSEGVETTVPIEKSNGAQEYSGYFVSVDGLQYTGASTGAGQGLYMVDSGTTKTTISEKEAARINALFDPPARYDEELGIFVLPCNATAPEFGVDIGGKTFMLNSEDLILDLGEDFSFCTTSFAIGESLLILGSVFLRSVLAVFDVGRKEMSFASRLYYEA